MHCLFIKFFGNKFLYLSCRLCFMRLTIYRILSFLLIPVAVIFTLCVIIMLGVALQNLAILLTMLIMACIAIYSFASLNFLIKGIDGKKHLRTRSKYLLKVTALVSALFVVMIISQCIILLLHPEAVQQSIAEAMTNFKGSLQFNKVEMENYLRAICYFFVTYGIVLGVHIIFSFQNLEAYNYLFLEKKEG